MTKYKTGQFFRDTVNGDLLKLLGFSDEGTGEFDGDFEKTIPYVRCAVIAHGTFFGPQEMRLATLKQSRFERVEVLKSLWYAWKYRDSQLIVDKMPKQTGPSGF